MSRSFYPDWQKNDYVIVRQMFDRDTINALRLISEDILTQWRTCDPQTGKPGATPDAAVMRHLNYPVYTQGAPERFDLIMNTITDARVLDVLRDVLREEPVFRVTSLFFNPTDARINGDWHRDAQFVFKGDEPAEQEMVLRGNDLALGIQVQTALVPSEDLELVPGSCRRWDTPEEYAVRKGNGARDARTAGIPGSVRISLQPGDAVLFNPLGIHRGRYHSDKLRRTLMLSYTKTSQPWRDIFCEQPWFLDDAYLRRIPQPARGFFDSFIAQYQDYWMRSKTQ